MSSNSEFHKIEELCELIEKQDLSLNATYNILSDIRNPSRKEWPGSSPLISAVKKGRKTLASQMLLRYNVDINSTTKFFRNGEWCALATTVHNRNFELSKYLVSKSANVNIFVMMLWGMLLV